jgi:hypothetical protein
VSETSHHVCTCGHPEYRHVGSARGYILVCESCECNVMKCAKACPACPTLLDAARALLEEADAACDMGREYTVNSRTGTLWKRLRSAVERSV